MGDSHQRRDRKVRLDYAFDRLLITNFNKPTKFWFRTK
jgi:hypothetical protein